LHCILKAKYVKDSCNNPKDSKSASLSAGNKTTERVCQKLFKKVPFNSIKILPRKSQPTKLPTSSQFIFFFPELMKTLPAYLYSTAITSPLLVLLA
jgi:hypothetical protein